MRNTVLNNLSVAVAAAALFCGCHSAPERPGLAAAQSAARARTLDLRVATALRDAADERVNRRADGRLNAMALDYAGRETEYDAATDPALNELEKAIFYAGLARSKTPAERARRQLIRRLDFEVAVRWSRLKHADARIRNDIELEIGVLTNWSRARIRAFDYTSLPAPQFRLLPIRPDAERRIAAAGHAAAFAAAAELYRHPVTADLAAAAALRDALINSHLMRGAARADTAKGQLELQLAGLRIAARSDL